MQTLRMALALTLALLLPITAGAAVADAVWTVWPDMDPLDLRNLLFECASREPRVASEDLPALSDVTLTYLIARTVQVQTGPVAGYGRLINPATGAPQ